MTCLCTFLPKSANFVQIVQIFKSLLKICMYANELKYVHEMTMHFLLLLVFWNWKEVWQMDEGMLWVWVLMFCLVIKSCARPNGCFWTIYYLCMSEKEREMLNVSVSACSLCEIWHFTGIWSCTWNGKVYKWMVCYIFGMCVTGINLEYLFMTGWNGMHISQSTDLHKWFRCPLQDKLYLQLVNFCHPCWFFSNWFFVQFERRICV